MGRKMWVVKMKFNKKELFAANELIRQFNRKNIYFIDWSEFFTNMTDEILEEFSTNGLDNADLVFSNWADSHGIKRKE